MGRAGADGDRSVSEEPVLEIGTIGGDDAYVLHQVAAAVKLPDGGVAVANAGSMQVRIYGANGAHLRDLEGAGTAPASFGCSAASGVRPEIPSRRPPWRPGRGSPTRRCLPGIRPRGGEVDASRASSGE